MEHASQSQGMADRRDFLINGLAIAYMKYTVRQATKIASKLYFYRLWTFERLKDEVCQTTRLNYNTFMRSYYQALP